MFTSDKLSTHLLICFRTKIMISYLFSVGKSAERNDSAASLGSMANGEDPAKLEKEHVLAIYDQIADHFSDTRHKPWPQVLEVGGYPCSAFVCGTHQFFSFFKLHYWVFKPQLQGEVYLHPRSNWRARLICLFLPWA